MRSKGILTLVAAVALAAPCAATTQQFEGIVKQRSISVNLAALGERDIDVSPAIFDLPIDRLVALRSELEPLGDLIVTDAELLIKGHLIRMDASDAEGPAYAIMDLERGIVRMVRPGERMYIEFTSEDLQPTGAGGSAPSQINATGQTKTINGMKSTAYDVETDEGVTRVWVSRDDANLAAAFLALSERMESFEPDVSMSVAEYGFPVLTQQLTYDSYEIEEVISVEHQSIPADRFNLPAGYTKQTMADLMGGLPSGSAPGRATSGASGSGSGSGIWVEYTVSGAASLAGREDDVVMCSENDAGLLARTLGDWIIDLEVEGKGAGRHVAEFTVSAPKGIAELQDDSGNDWRFRGDGTVTIEPGGKGAYGFDMVAVRFEASDLESGGGIVINLAGTLSCAVM